MVTPFRIVIEIGRVLLIGWIFVLFGILNLILYINHQSIYKKYITIKEKNEKLQIENRQLSEKLLESQEERKKLLERIGTIQKDLERISFERDEYKRKIEITTRGQEELNRNLKLIKEENALLKDQLSKKENERIELEGRLKKIESEKENLDRKLVKLEKLLKKRKKREISSEKVELPPIIVRPQELPSPTPSFPSVSGKIIAINEEYNFVIVDLGEEEGIKVGRSFDVFRDQNLIGKLEVIQTGSSVSACEIKSKSVDLEVGDSIR